MKYGDTLRQRSIPEWGHYNIDYDYLKDLIKHQTTPGTNKAVSIPGQGESTERAFGDTFFNVLAQQHDRINLFVRSKSGEIERRLEHISKTLDQLRARRNPASGRLPARIVERYAKIDADVARTGEEIRSLSRFQVTQRTGFIKILKKYKRWTKDRELSHVFKQEISSRPDSLFQLDLGYLLDQYIDVLDALRSAFDADGTSTAHAENTNGQSSAAHISRSIEKGGDLDFDLVMNTVPLGSKGNKATYWIHPDHIVEAQVLLLQHTRLYVSKARRHASGKGTPLRRHSSTTNLDPYLGSEDTTGVVVLDHPEAFAFKQNASTIGATEELQGSIGIKAAGQVRCCASGEAAVVVCTEADAQGQSPVAVKTAKMERKRLQSFLDTSVREDNMKHSENGSAKDDAPAVRQWLAEHQSTKPIAGAVSKRTRFTGLHNNSTGGIWATLDKDICLKDSLYKDLADDDWTSAARAESAKKFPHAVLEIRREGNQAMALIQTLDRSHLVERVRGFSLEAHAVWTCCKPSAMSAPFWISLLEKDIRKLPEPVKKRSRRGRESATGSQVGLSPPATSTSNTSYDGQSSPLASRYEESSATSVHEFVDPPPLQAFRKKSRKPYSDYPPPMSRSEPEPEVQQRYWNEYDHPEDEETGYYIYVDPDAPIKYPGQDFVEALARKTKKLFGRDDKADEASLSAAEDSDDDTIDSSPILHAANYGTTDTHGQSSNRDGYFSTLFRSLRDPRHDADLFNERRALLGQVETHQHKIEMTKLRFYSTALGAAVVMDLILGLMTMTSRKKERGVVDAAVLLGTISTLVLCVVAVISMRTRQERLGAVHQGAVLSIAAAVVALDVLLLLWVLRI
ncbi:hypothetical protein J4E90_001681 [Alternaria incomplexa]|uniref:uncharacterized protein n=1 Tax=Alternaria incomplexa TaxID=1187928 RepID=UPI00221F7DA2|nr:uncharacterized protein J4E90_001681 [Alternaria incomplexa]KAI4919545.1 hypothetical protein J4E90_001681 [Alternaria incomplexa]